MAATMTMTTTTTKTTIIPAIDFSPFVTNQGVTVGQPPTPSQIQVAEQIDDTCRGHGFLCLSHFGMSAELRDRIFASSKELFELSGKDKGKLCRISPSTNTGYSPFQSECINRSRPPELKEAFNVRFPPSAHNDLTGCPEGFEELVDILLEFYKDLATRYAYACALALRLPHDFFVRTLSEYNLCTIRLLHYPPCDHESVAGGQDGNYGDVTKPIRIGEHTDFGAFTFLLVHPSFGPDGLQIKPVEGGDSGGSFGGEGEGWQTVQLPPSAEEDQVTLIVNTGALMARWTNDEWKATAHRVVIPDQASANRSRYSVAMFVDPDSDSIVDVHDRFVGDGKRKMYEPITSSDYLDAKLNSMMKR